MDYNKLSNNKMTFLGKFGTMKHADGIMSSNNVLKSSALEDSPNLTTDHVQTIMDSNNNFAKARMIKKNRFITPEHIHNAIHSGNAGLISNAIVHPLASSDDITFGINHADPHYRELVVKNPSLSMEHIKKIFSGDDVTMKHNIINHIGDISNPKSTAMLNIASNDHDSWVSSVAKRKLTANKKQGDEEDALLKELYA